VEETSLPKLEPAHKGESCELSRPKMKLADQSVMKAGHVAQNE